MALLIPLYIVVISLKYLRYISLCSNTIKYLHNFVVCETMLLFVENALECFDLIIIMTRGADSNIIISPT